MKTSLVFLAIFWGFELVQAEYSIGVGIADVTGPTVEITFMGYGKTDQKGTGLHLRQWARCFIIDDGKERIAFISVDVGMIGDGLRNSVIRKLQRRYNATYNQDNVIISGTHTHSAPGGFLLHLLFDLPSLGFSAQTFGSLVSGIVKCVVRAHERLQPGRIFISKGHVEDANINRSPTAYEQNPEEEKAKYPHNTDTEMVQMKFVTTDMKPLGVISWFAVHPTSMNNTNTLVSSDNMGYASILFEKRMNPGRVPGKGPFVAAMASSNLGDVSPNIRGPRCEKTGRECDIHTSTCPVKWDQCVSPGPGIDMFDSTRIIASRIYQTAWDLFNNDERIEVKGPLKVVHQYRDMPSAVEEIVREDGSVETVRGCLPAMGYSFAAGTTDGPGAFSFQQGTVTANQLWNIIRDFLAKPTVQDEECHKPKPILLATGHMKAPFEWQPRIVSTQLALIGNVAIAAVPGEFTTMAGRRLRNLLTDELSKGGIENPIPIVAGLCNTYSDYITTFEEYQVQRYEGASTIYGPHTLTIHLNQYRKLVNALMKNIILDRGPEPPELFNDVISFIPPVIWDNPIANLSFGEPTLNPKSVAHPGEKVLARFVSGNPRNCLKHDETFCTVEREEGEEGSDVWTVVATDADWETKVRWYRRSSILGTSETEVEYTVPEDARPGTYRIRHFGCYKYMFRGIYPYVGTSLTFKIVN